MTTPTKTSEYTHVSENTGKLQQTARKLGLSVKSLEQYMAAKTAEVSPRQQPSQTHR
jgi:hypothetical protein